MNRLIHAKEKRGKKSLILLGYRKSERDDISYLITGGCRIFPEIFNPYHNAKSAASESR